MTPDSEALTIMWDAFCDADPLPNGRDIDEYLSEMEDAGLIELRDVEPDDLDDPFAWERGIEPGGMVWTLTEKGKVARAQITRLATPQTDEGEG